jgi:two-component sensor histidine kinase
MTFVHLCVQFLLYKNSRIKYKKPLLGFFTILLGSLPGIAQNHPDTTASRLEAQLAKAHTDTVKVNALLAVALYFANKPGDHVADLNKAYHYANDGLVLSQTLKFPKGEGTSYIAITQILKKEKNITLGLTNERQAIAFFKNHPFPIQEIDADLETGNYYNEKILDGLGQKIAFYEIAVTVMRKTHPGTLRLARSLRNLGNLHMYVRADEPKAVDELKEALAIYKTNGQQQLQDIYGLLTGLLSDLDDYQEALKYGLLAVKAVERYKDTSKAACAAYDNLGTLYYGFNDFNNASKFHIKGLALARKTKDLPFIFDITHDLSIVYSKMHAQSKAIPNLLYALKIAPTGIDISRKCLIISDLLSAFMATEQYGQGQKYVDPLLKLIPQIKDDNIAKNNSRITIINYFLATHQYAKISPILKDSRDYALLRKQIKPISAIELYEFKLDSAQQRYSSAINHYQRFKVLSDSVNKRNQDRQLAVLQIQYDTEKKNQEIAIKSKNISLLTRQTQLQETTLRSQKQARNLLFGGVALLILLLGLIYSRYRIKQRANQELFQQQQEINNQNDSLKQLLTEREWLLKEVHHRVKNNLQIVISLLNSQSAYLKDPAMRDVLKESQNRMRSISLIHQKLYQGDNLSGIDMFNYIHELTGFLQDSFDTQGNIAFLLDIDKVTMDVSQTVPIGLILNEAITNAIKYAFKDRENGQIRIMLKITDGDRMLLRITDNGQGLPKGFNTSNLKSLGMNLMKGLSRQLGAEFEVKDENGLCIQLTGKKASILSNPANVKLSDYSLQQV